MLSAAGRSSVLVPGVALAAAGVVALSPVLPPAPAVSALPQPVLPAVHIDDIDLTGIGQDIYYAITPAVQYVVGGVSYLINFIPLIGGPIAAQININYFQGIQPVVEATVNYLAAVVQDPLNFIASTQAYGSTLYDIGYNWVSAQLVFLGLQPLPPLPQSAAAGDARGPRAAAAAGVAVQPVRGEAATPAASDPETSGEAATADPLAADAPAAEAVEAPAAVSPRERNRATRPAPRTAPQLGAGAVTGAAAEAAVEAAAEAPGAGSSDASADRADRADAARERPTSRVSSRG